MKGRVVFKTPLEAAYGPKVSRAVTGTSGESRALRDKEEVPVSESTVSTTSTSSGNSRRRRAQWRSLGKHLRKKWISKTPPLEVIDPESAIDPYIIKAQNSLEQFLRLEVETVDESQNAYIVGHRLFQFLRTSLPRHPYYHTVAPDAERLMYIVDQYLDKLAVQIDQWAYQDHIFSVISADDALNTSTFSTNSHTPLIERLREITETPTMQATPEARGDSEYFSPETLQASTRSTSTFSLRHRVQTKSSTEWQMMNGSEKSPLLPCRLDEGRPLDSSFDPFQLKDVESRQSSPTSVYEDLELSLEEERKQRSSPDRVSQARRPEDFEPLSSTRKWEKIFATRQAPKLTAVPPHPYVLTDSEDDDDQSMVMRPARRNPFRSCVRALLE